MIKEHDFYEWKSTCLLYASLNTYIDSVNTIRMHTWWIVNQKLPHLYKSISAVMAVLMGGQPSGLQRNFDRKLCQICCDRVEDNAIHVILSCNALTSLRDTLLRSLYDSMPNSMLTCYQIMSPSDKVAFLLSPLSCSFVQEWLIVYENIANMVFKLYSTRAILYDSETEPG